jgi:hypothetical protein
MSSPRSRYARVPPPSSRHPRQGGPGVALLSRGTEPGPGPSRPAHLGFAPGSRRLRPRGLGAAPVEPLRDSAPPSLARASESLDSEQISIPFVSGRVFSLCGRNGRNGRVSLVSKGRIRCLFQTLVPELTVISHHPGPCPVQAVDWALEFLCLSGSLRLSHCPSRRGSVAILRMLRRPWRVPTECRQTLG